MSEPVANLDAIVIGAGHAGLAISRCLQREGLAHLVLEKDRVAASWRTRWDSFCLNTPNAINGLPDGKPPGPEESFATRDEWVQSLEAYRAEHDLPVREGVTVSSVRPVDGGYEVIAGGERLRARQVVLCTGDQNVPKLPSIAEELPSDIEQLHARDYRSPLELPQGAVLVVGSGQSGGQIVQDLLAAGREVWLCTSHVGWVPRRYRGRDLTQWIQQTGMYKQGPGDVEAAERAAAQPLLSGTEGGHSISLQLLGRQGAKLLGRLSGTSGRKLGIADDLEENLEFGNAVAAKIRGGLDLFIEKAGVDAPAAEPDPADPPFDGAQTTASIRELDLDEAGVKCVIWATGFGGDFSYLPAELLDEAGKPRHEGGICQPGLYVLGLTWLRRRISGLVAGVEEDAQAIVEQMRAHSS